MSGLIRYQPEHVFQDFSRGRELVEHSVQIKRKLENWLQGENFKFAKDSSVAFEEKVAEREARTGLSQTFMDADLDGSDAEESQVEPDMNEEEFSEALLDADEI